MPSDHHIAIDESSRMSAFLVKNWIPSAEKTAKITAPSNGFKPRKKAMPIPPKDAWVIPPLIKTIRFETM